MHGLGADNVKYAPLSVCPSEKINSYFAHLFLTGYFTECRCPFDKFSLD